MVMVKAEAFEARSQAWTPLNYPLRCRYLSPGIKIGLLSTTLGLTFHCEWP